jgi:pantetheine-phosphate adenylyltransferase
MTIEEISKRYNERHRYFHTPMHLNKIISCIYLLENENPKMKMYHDVLVLTTLFHDIVYYPWLHDNENKSVKLFKQAFTESKYFNIRDTVSAIIMQTKNHDGISECTHIFNDFDLGILIDSNCTDFQLFIDYEQQIFKEYQFLNIDMYISKRIKFLKTIESQNPYISKLIDYIKNKKYNIAIYPGSFNPWHIGHQNILEQAEKLYDKVIIVKAINENKNVNIINIAEQFEVLQQQLPDRETKFIEGNIIKTLFVNNIRNPILIRGIRNSEDLIHEKSYLRFCKDFYEELRYSLIFCDDQFSHISSSALKSLDDYSSIQKKYIPQCYTKIL